MDPLGGVVAVHVGGVGGVVADARDEDVAAADDDAAAEDEHVDYAAHVVVVVVVDGDVAVVAVGVGDDGGEAQIYPSK